MVAALRLLTRFLKEHPTDAARELESIDPAEAAAILADQEPGIATGVWQALAPFAASGALAQMDLPAAAAILCRASTGKAAVALRQLTLPVRRSLIEHCPDPWRSSLEKACSTGASSAGRVMTANLMALPADWTVLQARQLLAANPERISPDLFVVDRDWRLAGRTDLRRLGTHAAARSLAGLMQPNPPHLKLQTPVAAIREDPLWRKFDVLPVVDAGGLLAGAISHLGLRSLEEEYSAEPLELGSAVAQVAELTWSGYVAAMDVAFAWTGAWPTASSEEASGQAAGEPPPEQPMDNS